MNRISSDQTFFFKRVFPALWFGFLLVFLGIALVGDPPEGQPAPPQLIFLGMPVLMGIFGFVLMKRFVFDLADEVLDGGDHLVVRFGADTQRIPLGEIINIGWTSMVNPPRVVLTLRNSGRFGREVAFSPKRSGFWEGANPTVAALIQRVDAARLA